MKTLIDLKASECRWPVKTTKRSHLFCGQPAEEGRPYCACHRQRSLDPDQTRTPRFRFPSGRNF